MGTSLCLESRNIKKKMAKIIFLKLDSLNCLLDAFSNVPVAKNRKIDKRSDYGNLVYTSDVGA